MGVPAATKRKKSILLVLLIFVMAIIFYMSHQPGDDSSGMSREVCRVICQVVVADFEEMTTPEQEKLLDSLEFWIRKGAHCFEYMILGILLYVNMTLHAEGRKDILCATYASFGMSLAAGVLYAVSDEIHQYFIPGRSCELRDVCIDSVGVLIGVTVMIAVQKKQKRKP